MTATILDKHVPVRHNVRKDVGREYLMLDVPEGWDDVKKICKKVLEFNGKKFTFTGWNSDRNECFFSAPIHGDSQVARIL
jgi:hypothetical protein